MFIGTGKVDGAYIGSSAVSKMYLGTTKVWPLTYDWFVSSNRTLDYSGPADQYEPHTWAASAIAERPNNGEKWLGTADDKFGLALSKASLGLLNEITVELTLVCPDGRPGAGVNEGFSQFRMAIAGASGWVPSTVTLNRTDATYSAYKNILDDWYETWTWAAADSGMTADTGTHNDNSYLTTNTGILV